jgi:hypothetical protein
MCPKASFGAWSGMVMNITYSFVRDLALLTSIIELCSAEFAHLERGAEN